MAVGSVRSLFARALLRCALPALASVLTLAPSSPLLAADSQQLQGIHWWDAWTFGPGGQPDVDSTPSVMLQSVGANKGAWTTEIVLTDSTANNWFDPAVQVQGWNVMKNTYIATVIGRIDYKFGETVPSPSTMSAATWATTHVAPTVNTLKNAAHIYQLGNEPNITSEGTNWTNGQVTPVAYANIYKEARAAVQTVTPGSTGAHRILVAPAAPVAAGGAVWKSGNAWLEETIQALQANGSPIDGFALHAYGPTAADFRRNLSDQLAIIDKYGLKDKPVYITEWNRTMFNAADETAAAQFVRDVYAMVDKWNNTPGNHNVKSLNWFVYDTLDSQNGSGPWDRYSIEYWKNNGNPVGPNDIYTAHLQVSAKGYKAGVDGSRSLPSGVTIMDSFEYGDANNGNGRFRHPLTFAAAGAYRYGFNTATSSVVRDLDHGYSAQASQRLTINDSTATSGGWRIRHLSGDADPSTNVQIPITPDASIGFFYKIPSTYSSSTLNARIVVDSNGVNGAAGGDVNATDMSGMKLLIADGEWHFVDWRLDGVWESFNGSDGILPTLGYVTLDSILITNPNDTSIVMYLDTIGFNSQGSFGVMVPEPGSVTLVAMAGLGLLGLAARRRRARRRAS